MLAHIVLEKQTNMVWAFIYIPTLCMGTVKELHGWKFKISKILKFWNSNFKTCKMAT